MVQIHSIKVPRRGSYIICGKMGRCTGDDHAICSKPDLIKKSLISSYTELRFKEIIYTYKYNCTYIMRVESLLYVESLQSFDYVFQYAKSSLNATQLHLSVFDCFQISSICLKVSFLWMVSGNLHMPSKTWVGFSFSSSLLLSLFFLFLSIYVSGPFGVYSCAWCEVCVFF